MINSMSWPEPIDNMDACFQRHDVVYNNAANECNALYKNEIDRLSCRDEKEIQADIELVNSLGEIITDPKAKADLMSGKNNEEQKYAETFLNYAHWWFSGKLTRYQMENQPLMP